MELTKRQINNFWKKIQKTDSCWLWVGCKRNGYGRVNLDGKVYLAHRISCLLNGKLDNPLNLVRGACGNVVRHTCDVRNCVNPEHLIVGTQKENMLDAKQKGRKWYGENSGENHPKAKLDWEKIKIIRSSLLPSSQLSKMFGVDKTQIYLVRKNKSWITA